MVPSRSISCTLYRTTHHLMTTENRDWFINMVKRETTSSVSEENVSSSHSLPMVLLWCALCVVFPFLIPHSFHNYTECVSPLLPNRVHGALLLPTCMRANRELFFLCPFFFSATRWRKGPNRPTTVEHSRVQKLFPFTSKRSEKKFFRTRIVMLYRDGCRRHTAALARIFPSLSDTWIITNTGKNTSNFIYIILFFFSLLYDVPIDFICFHFILPLSRPGRSVCCVSVRFRCSGRPAVIIRCCFLFLILCCCCCVQCSLTLCPSPCACCCLLSIPMDIFWYFFTSPTSHIRDFIPSTTHNTENLSTVAAEKNKNEHCMKKKNIKNHFFTPRAARGEQSEASSKSQHTASKEERRDI